MQQKVAQTLSGAISCRAQRVLHYLLAPMAGAPLSDDEVGRRLAAARGHQRESGKEFAKRMGEHRTRIKKWELGKFGTRSRDRQGVVDQYVDETGLPKEFFAIDLADLPMMAEILRQAEPKLREQAEAAVRPAQVARDATRRDTEKSAE